MLSKDFHLNRSWRYIPKTILSAAYEGGAAAVAVANVATAMSKRLRSSRAHFSKEGIAEDSTTVNCCAIFSGSARADFKRDFSRALLPLRQRAVRHVHGDEAPFRELRLFQRDSGRGRGAGAASGAERATAVSFKGNIAVVGAGIGGLALAGFLSRQGVDLTVYEQAKSFLRIGAGIQISPNAVRVVRELGLEQLVRQIAFAPRCVAGMAGSL
jgi:hypothetical protein